MVMDNFLLVILTIPLIDISLLMDLYKVHNLLPLHPEVQFSYILEGQYLAISKHGVYAAIPNDYDIRICMGTEVYPYMLSEALYP